MITEQQNPNSTDIDLKSISEIAQIFHEEDRKAVEAVATESDAITHAVEMIVESFRLGGRLFYVGAGTSGRLGVLDASECPPTFRTPPEMVQELLQVEILLYVTQLKEKRINLNVVHKPFENIN